MLASSIAIYNVLGSGVPIAAYSVSVKVTILFTLAVVLYVSVLFLTVLASPVSIYCCTKGSALAGIVANVDDLTLPDDSWLNAI